MRVSNIDKKNWKCDFCGETKGEITFTGNSLKYVIRKKAGQWKLSWDNGHSMHPTLGDAKKAVSDKEVHWTKAVSYRGTVYYQGLAGGARYCEKCLRKRMEAVDAALTAENQQYREGDLHPSYMSSVVFDKPNFPTLAETRKLDKFYKDNFGNKKTGLY